MDEQADQAIKHFTIEAAAARSGKSVKTVRRWIKTGRLAASTVTTVHGPAYRIAPEALDHAASMVDVMKRPAASDLAAAVAVALAERDAQWLARLDGLETEIRSLREEVSRRLLELPVGRTEPPTETTPKGHQEAAQPPVRRPWWRRWLGG